MDVICLLCKTYGLAICGHRVIVPVREAVAGVDGLGRERCHYYSLHCRVFSRGRHQLVLKYVRYEPKIQRHYTTRVRH